jgi:methionyl aminopeptidase
VIAVEPMVNTGTKRVGVLKDQWTIVTSDKLPSAHFEHTLAITGRGVRILTGPPITEDEKLDITPYIT